MILEVASALFAGGCAWASARRLVWAAAPTALDHRILVEALGERRGPEARAVLRAALDGGGVTGWERDLLDAAEDTDMASGLARIGEQVGEYEHLAARWAGVPRVCARLASSMGFLLATVALLQGLELPVEDGFSGPLGAALGSSLGALAIGIAGTSFCAAVHFRARRARRDRTAAAGRLVDHLTDEAWQASPTPS